MDKKKILKQIKEGSFSLENASKEIKAMTISLSFLREVSAYSRDHGSCLTVASIISLLAFISLLQNQLLQLHSLHFSWQKKFFEQLSPAFHPTLWIVCTVSQIVLEM